MRTSFLPLAAFLLSCVNAGTVLWDGRFNEFTSATDLDKWSWGNQVGPYQWYIHGTQPTTRYVNLSPSYKNPADTSSTKGAKITIDSTALWNSNMWRTELIPQTKSNIATGRLYYHFSVKKTSTNAPKPGFEHQVVFFESHFTELKYGAPGSSDNKLHWYAGGQSRWSVEWQPDVWHNFVYDIDFSAGRVGLWHSTGGAALTQIVAPVSASTSSNSADFHVGVLRLPGNGGDTNPEDWYFSGVYVESGSLTTTIGDGSNPPVSSTTTAPPVSTPTSTSIPPTSTEVPPPSTTSTTAQPQPTATSPKWGQCGGIGWSGPTACVSGSTCTKLNDYYSQCI